MYQILNWTWNMFKLYQNCIDLLSLYRIHNWVESVSSHIEIA